VNAFLPPPELVIEILASRRGNVERTEKHDDQARGGMGEYWIVNPIDRIDRIMEGYLTPQIDNRRCEWYC